MHEVFEHTADLGLRIHSLTLPALFAEAGEALFELVIENYGDVNPITEHVILLAQNQLDLLFFDWLNELLYLFEAKHFIGCRFAVNYQNGMLQATVSGEPLDEARHHLDHEVKAITYHHLKVAQQPNGTWLAEVIVDI